MFSPTKSASFISSLPNTQVHTLVVAAGTGSRFGADIPKQYVCLNNQTVLLHSLKKIAGSRFIKHVFLVIAKDDAHISSIKFPIPVTLVTGGSERWLSVMAGVNAIDACPQASGEDLVVIHDAARPGVTSSQIDEVIEAACQERYGAILGVPVVDTIKKVDADHCIAQTLDRSCLWQAQTPQVFRLGALKDMLYTISERPVLMTDEASGFEALGLPIRMVEGSMLNIKLTRPEDKLLLETVLLHQATSERY